VDITAGPSYLADVLRQAHDEDSAEVGEEPRSVLEVASDKLAEGRREARRRVTRGKGKVVKVQTIITITDFVSPGNGDAARLETEFSTETKISKAPPIKGRGAWVDGEGNQIGKVEKNLTIAVVDGGKSIEAARAAKAKKVSAV
jgi:hypothetical protein